MCVESVCPVCACVSVGLPLRVHVWKSGLPALCLHKSVGRPALCVHVFRSVSLACACTSVGLPFLCMCVGRSDVCVRVWAGLPALSVHV